MQIEWCYKSYTIDCMLRHVYSYGLFVCFELLKTCECLCLFSLIVLKAAELFSYTHHFTLVYVSFNLLTGTRTHVAYKPNVLDSC